MNTQRPAWATLRTEQIRDNLSPEQRGPWREQRLCTQLVPLPNKPARHAAEPPYFYHCVTHLKQIWERHGRQEPSSRRDHGLCNRCGEPAEPQTKVIQQDHVAAAHAERFDSTIARITTNELCANCNTRRIQICKGKICKQADQELKVLPGACCRLTRKGTYRHCTLCCADTRSELRKTSKDLRNSKAGHASGVARKKKQNERRKKLSKLARAGLSVPQIAKQLQVSTPIIENDLKILRQHTQPARDASKRKQQKKQQQMKQLLSEGLNETEIAEHMGTTLAAVRRNLQTMREAGED